MRVSVIIPVYNNRRIKDCLNSVLNQTYSKTEHEVIMVDNNCTEEIKEPISRFHIKVIEEISQGSYCARNTGLKRDRQGPSKHEFAYHGKYRTYLRKPKGFFSGSHNISLI